jgi:riboflavin-specific deaminase-like protein
VLADDPRLTVRAVAGRSPARVVVDSSLRTPATAAVLNLDAPTYLMTNCHAGNQDKERLLAERYIAVRHVPQGPGGLDIGAVLRQLYAEGIRSVVAEGGPRVLASLVARNLADRVVVAISPQLHGRDAHVPGAPWSRLSAHPLRLSGQSVHLVGDWIVTAADLTASPAVRPPGLAGNAKQGNGRMCGA